MSATVRDCMNPKLVYLREGDRARLALQPILDFGIHDGARRRRGAQARRYGGAA